MNTTNIAELGLTEEGLVQSLFRHHVPIHNHDGLILYVMKRVKPGAFLTSVLENDLSNTFLRADARNLPAIGDILSWAWNTLPASSWGSPEKVAAWVEGK